MIGYQHMYTTVYKCLTAHGIIIHTEQVPWDMEAPLGIFPGSGESKPAAPREAPTVVPSDLWRPSSGDAAEPRRKPTPIKTGAPPLGVIRLVKANVYDPTGKPRPKDYIFDRVRHVDGLTVEEARLRRFPDSRGRLKRYSGDLAYDIATGWVQVEPIGTDSKEASIATVDSASFGNAALPSGSVTSPSGNATVASGNGSLFSRHSALGYMR